MGGVNNYRVIDYINLDLCEMVRNLKEKGVKFSVQSRPILYNQNWDGSAPEDLFDLDYDTLTLVYPEVKFITPLVYGRMINGATSMVYSERLGCWV